MFYNVTRIQKQGRSGSLAGLAGLVILAAALVFAGCSSSGDGDNPSNSPSALSVTTASPSDGASGVGTNGAYSVMFSKELDPATVSSSSFYIEGVSGTASASGTTATFVPSTTLSENSSHTLVATTAIKDINGQSMSAEYRVSFTTGITALANAGEDKEIVRGGMLSLSGGSNLSGTVTYNWTQIFGPNVGSLNGQFPSVMAPDDIGTLIFTLSVDNGGGPSAPDTVMVFVMGDSDGGFWVSPTGSDANPGTRDMPMASIQAAIDSSIASPGNPDIYISAGTWDETITLAPEISIWGGYDPITWIRDFGVHTTTIEGGPKAVVGVESNNVTLDGLTIHSADAADSGSSSVVVTFVRSTGVNITNNILVAGNGMAGSDGSRPGVPNRAPNGSNGTKSGGCIPANGGGAGGNSSNDGGKGGNGGAAGGKDGGGGAGPCGNGADGGFASSGKEGDNGCGGADGAHETVPGPEFGSIETDGSYSVANGYRGDYGAHGGGGGGGGGGAGSLLGCGGGGGGGGAGGYRGIGGPGGQGGGGSFGIILADQSEANIVDNSITTAAGGDGGAGALGGSGGLGGWGGSGGAKSSFGWAGGDGGHGGRGGTGGSGSGGGGGPSIAIVEQGSTSFQQNINFSLGSGGSGGPGGHEDAATGLDGLVAEIKKIQ